MVKLKKSVKEDLKEILSIIKDGQEFLKLQGLDQWQNGYPNEESILIDINNSNSFVLTDDDKIVATAAIIFGIDPNYNTIYQGKWLTNNEYVVIHRIATKKEYRKCGYASKIIELLKEEINNKNINSIRIDTHEFNFPMQKMLEKNGFKKCGIIYLNNIINETNKRLAYEYIK